MKAKDIDQVSVKKYEKYWTYGIHTVTLTSQCPISLIQVCCWCHASMVGAPYIVYRNAPCIVYRKTDNECMMKENPDSPPYLISHGEKIGCIRVLLATHLEAADHRVCDQSQVQPEQLDATLEVAQSCSILFTRAVRQGAKYPQLLLLHSWWRHCTWRYRESWSSFSNSVSKPLFISTLMVTSRESNAFFHAGIALNE